MAYNKDFSCDDCNHVEEVWKARIVDDFVYEKCVKCGSKNVRMVFGNITSDVAVGSMGNASTNYSNSPVYHPSKYGKFSGTRIK